MDSLIIEIADSLETLNSNITPASDMEDYEKSINAVYFSKTLRKLELDSADKSLVDSIASLCILEGGMGTFKARGIWAHYNDSVKYDDYTDCLEAGNNNRKADNHKIKPMEVLIYPNPANELINVKLINADDLPANIAMYEAMGNLVYTEKLTSTMHIPNINISNWLPGIYFLQIKSEEKIIAREKFAVVK